MSFFTFAAKQFRKIRREYYALALAVTVVTAAIVFAVSGHTRADSARECGEVANGVHNSIANNPDSGGGCGALSPAELITDIKNGNPDDQAGIYAAFGLGAGDYNRFKDTAVMGVAKTDGTVEVDGQVVMSEAWSIGRVKFPYSSPFHIDGVGDYFKSDDTDVLKSDIPAMVMFDDSGTAQAAIMTSCGNPIKAKVVKSNIACKMLNKTKVEGKDNTFQFTTVAEASGLAKVVKVSYFVDEGDGPTLFATEDNPSTPVTREFTKNATVIAKVTFSIPGKQTRTIDGPQCKQVITVAKKEVPPPPPTPPAPKPQPKVLPAQAPTPMPVTGPADTAGLFVGTSLAGAVGHRLYRVYRDRKRR